jgi:hypothetical protein
MCRGSLEQYDENVSYFAIAFVRVKSMKYTYWSYESLAIDFFVFGGSQFAALV